MLIEKLEEKADFSSIETEIADYILHNGEKIKDMSIQKLSEETYSSPATIVRLCRKVGVKGYTDFRIKFYAEYEEHSRFRKKVNMNIPFEKTDSYEVVASNLENLVINTVQDTMRNMNFSYMKRIVRRMLEAHEFYVFGEGSSLHAAIEFKTKMLRLGKCIFVEESQTHQKALSINAGKKSFSIIISYSGETSTVVDIVKILKEKGCYTLAITSDAESTAATLASEVLLLGGQEDKSLGKKLESFTSHNSVHFILDCLYSFYFLENYEDNEAILKKNAARVRSL